MPQAAAHERRGPLRAAAIEEGVLGMSSGYDQIKLPLSSPLIINGEEGPPAGRSSNERIRPTPGK